MAQTSQMIYKLSSGLDVLNWLTNLSSKDPYQKLNVIDFSGTDLPVGISSNDYNEMRADFLGIIGEVSSKIPSYMESAMDFLLKVI